MNYYKITPQRYKIKVSAQMHRFIKSMASVPWAVKKMIAERLGLEK